MISFLIALGVLIGGYFIYGTLMEKVFGIDPARTMPAYFKRDNVDFMPLPTWKVFLIQFLNIAGLGPIFGAIMGIMFGPAAFLWIVFGTIFGGAVHDFMSAMISIRSGGLSLPDIVGQELGAKVKTVMRVFSLLLLLLVGAVFILTPSQLLAGMMSDGSWWANPVVWTVIIFIYYMLATMLPIDKLIGNLYPVFGFALLFMAVGLLGVMLFGGVTIPDGFAEGLYNRSNPDSMPIFPMMFVSIACGAISGFHATQSPMMARCLKNERLARPVFYGAMVAEGIVALIWAAAAITFTGGYEQLAAYMADGHTAGSLVHDISMGWLGAFGGVLAIIGVIAAPISTGDTALRSARLITADFLKYDQKRIVSRLIVSVPLFAVTLGFMLMDFNVLWRYFAWSNQTLAVFTLWAVTVYLARRERMYVVAMIPALFMTVVSVTYIMFAPEGLRLSWSLSVATGVLVALCFAGLFVYNKSSLAEARLNSDMEQ